MRHSMRPTPRQRFLSYVRDPRASSPVVSPFLPSPGVIAATLHHLHLPVTDDDMQNEVAIARALDYEPMFMTECSGLIFNWHIDESRSTAAQVMRFIPTAKGEWTRPSPRQEIPWSDETGCAVRAPEDHDKLVCVCEQVGEREKEIREYFRTWRRRVGEDGVIVIGHPHPGWLGYQINPSSLFFHWNDHQELFVRSMEAIYEASLFVMSIAMEERIDFMSDSSYGLEMTSPALFGIMDLPYLQRFSAWTHERGGLFWYHNCGHTQRLIKNGTFNMVGADVIETIAPPPEGDNDLQDSRRHLANGICTKGNLNLRLLRDGTPDEVIAATRSMVEAVRGWGHIMSTADAVLPGTPPENFIAFVRTARECAG
jgi:hypothetical protein